MTWQLNELDQQLIDLALAEDLQTPFFDATCDKLFADQSYSHEVQIISKDERNIILSGMPVLKAVMRRFTDDAKFDCKFKDGDIVEPGAEICRIKANAAHLLMAERTLLNFLRHLSAVATLTHQFVDLTKNEKTQILDTRKTTPGFRHLDKYAVHCGGGVNHRSGLYDAIMIKDTHIDLIGGMETALAKLTERTEDSIRVIVEIRDLTELQECIEHGSNKVHQVLLDNMDNDTLKAAVEMSEGIFTTEASGNISLNTIKAIAETGVDFASIGMLTHSAGNVDISIKGIK